VKDLEADRWKDMERARSLKMASSGKQFTSLLIIMKTEPKGRNTLTLLNQIKQYICSKTNRKPVLSAAQIKTKMICRKLNSLKQTYD